MNVYDERDALRAENERLAGDLADLLRLIDAEPSDEYLARIQSFAAATRKET